ncbi:MAG: type II toxin-antitoxin system RelE/ParE family toxin [Thermoplasmata archaeon]|nr:type II toxin-antitoxin system RelE/ParE family toxin [Thermoplasmata archaeon]
MSSHSVVVTRLAADDVIGLIRYISENLKNLQAAERHLELYLETIESLGDMPKRHPISAIPRLKELEIRLVSFGNYFIAY